MVIAIIAFAAAWLTVMIFRMEIRAQWWAYKLAQVESREERNYYIACLAAIGDKSLGAINRLTADPRPEIRETAVRILHCCPGGRARGMLLDLLRDQSDDVSSRAALEVAQRDDAPAMIPVLKKMLGEPDPRSARAAAVALGRIGNPDAESILIETLGKTSHLDVLAQAIDSLAMLHSKAAVPMLIEMLNDDRVLTALPASQRDAQRAILALQGELAAKGVDTQALLEHTRTQATLASVAARALQLITGVSFGDPTTQPAEGKRGKDEGGRQKDEGGTMNEEL